MIIDARIRPPYKSYLATSTPYDVEANKPYAKRLGLDTPPSAEHASMPEMFAEMEAAGITHGVITGRISDMWGKVPNEEIMEVVAMAPHKFVGIGAVSPRPTKDLFAELRRLKEMGLKGVNVDPGKLNPPELCSAAILYPFYAMCQELELIAYLTTNIHSAPNALWANPIYLDQVAADFPDLKIFVAHASYPFVHEICKIAYWRPNIYISPGLYLPHVPYGKDFVELANSWIGDRIIFSSSYPVASFSSMVEGYRQAPFTPEAYEKVMWKNAAELFGFNLDEGQQQGGGI